MSKQKTDEKTIPRIKNSNPQQKRGFLIGRKNK